MQRLTASGKPDTLREHVLWAESRFEKARLYFGHGTDNARDEAAWLGMHVLGISHEALDTYADRALTAGQSERFRTVAEQRIATRKPLAYLIHEAYFAGLKFYVDERVIVPRSLIGDFLHERFERWIDPEKVTRILDLCTGSGCIAIAAALAFPKARVDAVDISRDALAVARMNVDQHRLSERVELVESDLFANLQGRRYDLILTNPPYVDARDMASLPREYRHEPELALASGPSGLDAIIRILAAAPAHLSEGGLLVGEVGNSCVTLRERFPRVPFVWPESPGGDDSVFLIKRDALLQHAAAFRVGR